MYLSGFMYVNYLLLCAILSPILVPKDDIYSITVSVSQDSRQGVTGVVASHFKVLRGSNSMAIRAAIIQSLAD